MVTQAGRRKRLPSLGRDNTINRGPKFFIRKGSGVVEGDFSGAVEEHERWGGADAVDAEVLRTDRCGDVEKRGVVAVAGVADVGALGGGSGILAGSCNAVALGGRDHG